MNKYYMMMHIEYGLLEKYELRSEFFRKTNSKIFENYFKTKFQDYYLMNRKGIYCNMRELFKNLR